MYLVDRTYFIRELAIPGIDEMNSQSLTDLNLFIDEYVRELLEKKALGYTLFAEFDSYVVDGSLPAVPEDPDPDTVPTKWRNLVNGCTYTKDGETVRWDGLLFTRGAFKQSPLANFVFCQWLQWQATTLTSVGEKTVQAKNAVDATSVYRYVNIWNKFIEMYQGNFEPVTYMQDGCLVTDYYRGDSIDLLTFLSDNATDYPDAAMIGYEGKNSFGI